MLHAYYNAQLDAGFLSICYLGARSIAVKETASKEGTK